MKSAKQNAHRKGLGSVYLSIRLTNFSLSVCACAHVGGSLCIWLWDGHRTELTMLYMEKNVFVFSVRTRQLSCLRRYLGVHQLQTIRTYNRDSLNVRILARIVFPSIERRLKMNHLIV